MPKLYTYCGFYFFIYSNEEPRSHVHVSKAENEVRVIFNQIGNSAHWVEVEVIRNKFGIAELRKIDKFVKEFRKDILLKIDDFKKGKKITCETVNKIRKNPKKGDPKASKKGSKKGRSKSSKKGC